jgi:DNA polymerase III epsilon subunit-like protein
MSYLSNRIVIAYNASFDIRLLKQTADCYEIPFPALHAGCLMYAYAKYREVYVEQCNGQQRCKIHRLEDAMNYEQLNMPPLHRAERDAQCVYQLFQAIKVQSQCSKLL